MKRALSDFRLILVYLLVSLPSTAAGYAWEAATRSFQQGRSRFERDIYDKP